MDVLMREDTNVVEVEKSIKVTFADGLFKINRHGTKIVRVFVSYYEDGNVQSGLALNFAGRCGLLRHNAGITWEFFSEKCTPEIAEMVIDLFLYQDVVDYIKELPS